MLASCSVVTYRFTPTRVGTLSWRPSCVPRPPVHPHTRGDISTSISAASFRLGSPPHAWGHSVCIASSPFSNRFTPTRVGTFGVPFGRVATCSVHPHTRGDISSMGPTGPAQAGSPPHAWGHLPARFLTGLRAWFTPTRVGTLHPTIPSQAS